MNYNKQMLKILFVGFLLSLMMMAAVQNTRGQDKDTVKVSLSGMDRQIQQKEDELNTLLQQIDQATKQIEQAKQNSVYLKGALDNLRDFRNKFAVKDTVKTETKKKGK